MPRKRILVFALAVFLSVGAFNLSVSHGQGEGHSFIGAWKLTLDFNPPGMNVGAPVFTYAVLAQPVPLHLVGDDSPQPSNLYGGGVVVGVCSSAPAYTARAMTWRGTPLTGANATGVSMTFESQSSRSPSTIVLRGLFSVDGNTVTGTAHIISDTGFTVDQGTFTLERGGSSGVDCRNANGIGITIYP